MNSLLETHDNPFCASLYKAVGLYIVFLLPIHLLGIMIIPMQVAFLNATLSTQIRNSASVVGLYLMPGTNATLPRFLCQWPV